MTEPTQKTGGDAQNVDETVDAAAPTRSNAPQKPGRDPKLSERDALLAKIDQQVVDMRERENEEFLRSADVDPRAAALAVQMAKEARGEPVDTDRGHRNLAAAGGEETPPEGTTFVEPIVDDAAAQAREAVRISNKGEDPLGDYVVRVDGKPMFRTIVDGKESLIPLDRARAQLQKHLAADIRLQHAAERQKQLDAREQSIRNVEATLKTRTQPSATAPADDAAIDAQAVELVRSLVSEPEDKAAVKLAKTLKAIRQAPAPDSETIVAQAADRAVRTIAERDNQRALNTGLQQFTKDYPDIAGDPDLFNLADRKTNAIAEEHPEWSPGEVMLEAGKQTREWLKSLSAPVKAPGAAPKGEQPNNRQQRKQNLVPMPQSHTARPAATEEAPREQSPQDVMAEIRKSRGQAY